MRVLAFSSILSAASAVVAEVHSAGAVVVVNSQMRDDACSSVEKIKALIGIGMSRLEEMKDLLAAEGGVMKHEEAELKTTKSKPSPKAARAIQGERSALDGQARELALEMETIKTQVEMLRSGLQSKKELCALFRDAAVDLDHLQKDEDSMVQAEHSMEKTFTEVYYYTGIAVIAMRGLALFSILSAASAAVAEIQSAGAVVAVNNQMRDDACSNVEKIKALIGNGIARLEEMKDIMAAEGGVMKHEEAELKMTKSKSSPKAAMAIQGERGALHHQAREMALEMETIKAQVEMLRSGLQSKEELCALFRDAAVDLDHLLKDEDTMVQAEHSMEETDHSEFPALD
eukprot:CAMPEP_0204449336 /NCGR_PEP_ID=MMETSP0470-20130426/99788_1 /ASSEMBLY_ACC=CAM_ASM_000385 /TAXON_ID=2969 /ORGANISM="Oxyrrhis marina" /LENGTH=343 /DNA_ID=CAMNT_0051449153 /DNA_START=54 /DNA_END=1086 /DNA_ORIENTATION=+